MRSVLGIAGLLAPSSREKKGRFLFREAPRGICDLLGRKGGDQAVAGCQPRKAGQRFVYSERSIRGLRLAKSRLSDCMISLARRARARAPVKGLALSGSAATSSLSSASRSSKVSGIAAGKATGSPCARDAVRLVVAAVPTP